jgi:alcohol dehydrogenase class IV
MMKTMNEFKFHMPVKVFFGADCLNNNASELLKYGKRALIVTGGHSAHRSGALDDVIRILNESGADHEIFSSVENNPGLDSVGRAGEMAASFGADMIVGIGGGSPLDAAKAAAVLATNPIDPIRLYENVFQNKPLPIVAIPTTAGTGSEVTQYSILTRKDVGTKMSFGNESTFPVLAFLDPNYTMSMPPDVTANTAVDAFSHAMEGYLSKRAGPMSDDLALASMRYFAMCREALLSGDPNYTDRENLLYSSLLAGTVIAQTGTTALHAMGYALTYYKGVAHGRANGLLMEEYLRFNESEAGDRIALALKTAGFDGIADLGNFMRSLFPDRIEILPEEAADFEKLALLQRSAKNTPRLPNLGDLAAIFLTGTHK